MSARLILFTLLFGLSRQARAHCDMQYQVRGPGGLFFEVNLGGNHFKGVLPGGTTAQPGPMTTWTDHRTLDMDGGVMTVTLTGTDLNATANCSGVTVDLNGPPTCGEDGGPPSCTPSFTLTQNGAHSFSCSSSCVGYPQPADMPVFFSPYPSPQPALAAINPSSAAPQGPSVAVGLSGSGFIGASLAQWNGSPVTTLFLSASSLFALVPYSFVASTGTNNLNVLNPAGASAALAFSVTAGGAPPPPPPPPPDTTPPSVSITAPSNGSTVSGITTLSANASDNVAVAGLQFQLDSINLGSSISSAPYTYALNTASSTNGNHTVTAIATDAAGNFSSATIALVFNNVFAPPPDTSSPTIAITSPAAGDTVAGFVIATATAADNVGVAALQFQLDGVNVGPQLSSAPYSYKVDVSSTANGTHVIGALARDAAGNSATNAVTVAVNNPQAPAPAPPAPPTATATQFTLSTGRIYPNPWTPAAAAAGVIFDSLPANATIKIFSIAGRLVKILAAPSGSVTWDMTNDSGQSVSSGYYLYSIHDAEGGRRTGKLALVR